MSLRLKIAIGVLAATTVLAVALGLLALQAKQELDQTSKKQTDVTRQAYLKLNQTYRQSAQDAVESIVLKQLSPVLDEGLIELLPQIRDEAFIEEAAIAELREDGEITQEVVKPRGSSATMTGEERAVAKRVFESGVREWLGDVLFYPYNPNKTEKLKYLLRLKVPFEQIALEEPDPIASPNLGPLVIAAFTTLALAMVAVFVLLMFALRRFVLAPLGDVLEDSKRIVKGTEGLQVTGFKGGGGDIETLVAAFNAMFSELKDYQSDLEGKVKSATRTIQKQQQSLVVAQRLAATGTLAAGLAHEVNNPLSGMLNAVRRLKKREGLDERSNDYIGLIEEGLQRIEHLMKQILDFSRRRDMKPERFSAEAALRRALPLVKHRMDQKEIRLEEDIRQDLPDLYGNEEEVGQVLMNLLINAADASPDGGAVRVTLAPSDKRGVVMSIEDSGGGVPAEVRERIFDPFFTTKEPGKGTGLGLAIVHTVVDNHGGTVRVESGTTLGGAKFVVELPPAEVTESRRRKEAV
jgi:signal transduction histidine kinase